MGPEGPRGIPVSIIVAVWIQLLTHPYQGDQGPQGMRGLKGEKGAKGEIGDSGANVSKTISTHCHYHF